MSVLLRNQNRAILSLPKRPMGIFARKPKEQVKFTPAGMVSRIYSHGIELTPSFHRVYFQQPKRKHEKVT